MKRNIELIRDFIKFVENDMKEKYDYCQFRKEGAEIKSLPL